MLLKNGVYVCTIKDDDGPNDKSSKLYRENVYRISCSLDNNNYIKLFGEKPKRPSKGGVVNLPNNISFDDLDKVIPHPVYAWMGWICINSPTKENFNNFLKFIDISYNKAIKSYNTKIK